MRWMRTANRLGMWALIVLPTLWSGRDNLREHLGYGVGQPWTSAWDIVSGWGPLARRRLHLDRHRHRSVRVD